MSGQTGAGARRFVPKNGDFRRGHKGTTPARRGGSSRVGFISADCADYADVRNGIQDEGTCHEDGREVGVLGFFRARSCLGGNKDLPENQSRIQKTRALSQVSMKKYLLFDILFLMDCHGPGN